MAKIKKVESQDGGEELFVVVLDDGTEVKLEDIDGGFMRQSNYTQKTQALAEEKRALETANVNRQVDQSLNQQAQADSGNNSDMTKMYLDLKMGELSNKYGESFDEVAVLQKAASMLSKGISPTDIDFDFIARGLQNTVNDTDSLRAAMRKEIMAEMQQSGIDTSSIISSGDNGTTIQDGTFGLSPEELNYCRATGENPKEYAEWKKKLGR